MALALLKEEQEVIEAVRWFANLKRITSTAQVENRFARLSPVPGIFQVIEPHQVQAYRDDQEELRGWLSDIARSHGARIKLEPKLSMRLNNTVTVAIAFSHGRLIYQFGLTGVQACCAFGVALLLDEKKGMTSRFKQCRYSKCRKFNLDFTPKGRPRTFCNDECKKRFDNETAKERVRRFRRKYSTSR